MIYIKPILHPWVKSTPLYVITNAPFDYDRIFSPIHNLRGEKRYLKSDKPRSLAQKVPDRHHKAIAFPNMQLKGVEELKRYLTLCKGIRINGYREINQETKHLEN